MNSLLYIIGSTVLISLGALIGVFTLSVNQEKLNKFLLLIVSLSAGAMMGGAFIHLLPKATQLLPAEPLFLIVLFAFIIFFLIEKILNWHHCHDKDCEKHPVGQMNLLGDSIHNFIDGLIIAAAFSASTTLGIATALAVALHEIPQEIGDFGVLIYAGWEKNKALLANFLVALTVVLGGIVGFYLSNVGLFIAYLTPFAAGGFIYIAASDLLPEIRKETNLKKSFSSFAVFLAGIGIMYLLKVLG